MNYLSNLQKLQGTKKRKRVGRGQGSGKGRTAGRGHKGAASRSGFTRKIGFEGGQMPLYKRIPKFGFKNINRIEYKPVNLHTLQKLASEKKLTKIDKSVLIQYGIVSKNDYIKILAKGNLSLPLEVTAHAFSKTAKKIIEDNKGKTIIEKIR